MKLSLPFTESILLSLLALFALATARGWAEPPPVPAELPEFNRLVLEIAREYPTDGTHRYWWPRGTEGSYDGCSTDMYLDGVRVMRGEPEARTYCCGFTLEVFLKAYNQYREKYGDRLTATISPADWREFQRLWFVEKVNGPGPSAALEKFGLGREIAPEEAIPGDFVQIWRRWDPAERSNGSGHSVIFLEWARDEDGEITGIRYISTQPSTNGVGETVEHFAPPDAIKGVAAEFTWWGRAVIPLKPAG